MIKWIVGLCISISVVLCGSNRNTIEDYKNLSSAMLIYTMFDYPYTYDKVVDIISKEFHLKGISSIGNDKRRIVLNNTCVELTHNFDSYCFGNLYATTDLSDYEKYTRFKKLCNLGVKYSCDASLDMMQKVVKNNKDINIIRDIDSISGNYLKKGEIRIDMYEVAGDTKMFFALSYALCLEYGRCEYMLNYLDTDTITEETLDSVSFYALLPRLQNICNYNRDFLKTDIQDYSPNYIFNKYTSDILKKSCNLSLRIIRIADKTNSFIYSKDEINTIKSYILGKGLDDKDKDLILKSLKRALDDYGKFNR